jgi:hypothetical protein
LAKEAHSKEGYDRRIDAQADKLYHEMKADGLIDDEVGA